MCVPSVFIRDDGKGFVVRKGGIDWAVSLYGKTFYAQKYDDFGWPGRGDTIMEAVDSALAKVKDRE